ncbi:hypothetical protein QAD02_000923 [Eretmocerus hayati]|uniref:Uncharacterized protein n=1 Tax=Eretmocerus hayati TaxID=131215 RepID=A0ACC2NH50_9HYME|nr:hypothetical protein QAD02_000923 [Eretmocerus hayati]
MREVHQIHFDNSPTSAVASSIAAEATKESNLCLRAERHLALYYSLSFVCCILSLSCLGWVWEHWSWTLDICAEINCGCVLYGASGFSTFKGGEARLCHLALWILAPPLLVSLFMGIFHGYRVLVQRNLDAPRKSWLGTPVPTSATPATGGFFDDEDCEYEDFENEISPARGNGRVIVVGPKRRPIFKQWVPAGFLAMILACICLGQAVLVTDGYASTCEQYRRRLVPIISANGQQLQVINNRLGCGTIFDYMDYLHFSDKKYRHAGSINTGILLQISLAASWLNFILWAAIFGVNSIMARRRNKSLDEKIHSCI